MKRINSRYAASTRRFLRQIRAIVRSAAPGAEETILYGMPAFKTNGILVWFAVHANHICFYPDVSVIHVFQIELSPFKWAKRSIRFPLDAAPPADLITRIIRSKADENLGKATGNRK